MTEGRARQHAAGEASEIGAERGSPRRRDHAGERPRPPAARPRASVDGSGETARRRAIRRATARERAWARGGGGRSRSAIALLVAGVVAACGGGGPRASRDVREELGGEAAAAARERAPDLVARVEAAIEDADEAEARGDDAAAADHATRARLLLEAAQVEAARIEDEEARRAIEGRVAEILAQARRDERARERLSAELSRLAGARAAREEALRALEQAEEDEGRRGRQARVSLDETRDLRRGAAALRARARLTIGAARALGASDEVLAPALEAVERSEEARREPLEALRVADEAHRAALRALGAARDETEGPGPDGPGALAEAARAEGFEALALPEGTAVEAEGIFRGRSTRARGARIQRLAALAAAHPHGPIQIQVQVRQAGRGGERLAERRAETVRRALVDADVDATRLSTAPLDAALRPERPIDAVRLVFVAYPVAP